jgi:hydroxymethylpyrimidine/phosphomethylpyrimidine kinase
LLSTDLNIFKEQLTVLLDDVKVDALKLGMLANEDIVSIVVEIIDKYELKNIVLDTVLVSSSGRELLSAKAKELMVKELFPRVDLITPNLPEINSFLNASFVGKSSEVEKITNAFFALGVKNILIKGGHSLDKNRATDYLVSNSFEVSSFSSPRVKTTHTHGTGCLLSSAIATNLAKQQSLKNSVSLAKEFLYERLKLSSSLKFNYVDEKLKRKEPLI